jgi:hypothetical protein
MTTLPVTRRSPETCGAHCPHCEQKLALRIADLQACNNATVTCRCGHKIQLTRERRRFDRKLVQLSGDLLDHKTHKRLTTVSILNISLGGVCFVADQYDIQVDQRFTICFVLDDECRTRIQDDIVVRNVRGPQYVGAEFLHTDGYNFDLDFYLSPYVILI